MIIGHIRSYSVTLQKNQRKTFTLKKSLKCEFCEFETTYVSEFQSHLNLHTRQEKVFKCQQCSFQSKFASVMKIHKLLHKTEGPRIFKCNICSFQSKSETLLEKHSILHKTLRCEMCSFEAEEISILRRHISLNHKAQIKNDCKLNCTHRVDQNNSSSQIIFKQHNILHKKLKCLKCPYEAEEMSVLRRHVFLVHKDQVYDTSRFKIYSKLEKCDSKSKFVDDLKTNQLPLETDATRIFKCNTCRFQSDSETLLKEHVTLHKTLKCQHCLFKTDEISVLRRHIFSDCKLNSVCHIDSHTNNDTIFKCPYCSYNTKFYGRLAKHKTSHMSLKCSICNYECTHQRHFDQHFSRCRVTNSSNGKFDTTSKDRFKILYKCNSCCFQTKLLDTLIGHKKTHVQGEKQ